MSMCRIRWEIAVSVLFDINNLLIYEKILVVRAGSAGNFFLIA